jgi:hypothetical protein
MKKKLEHLPERLKNAVMSAIQDYIDRVDICDFDLDGEVGLIYRYKNADGEINIYSDADVYWQAEITFEILTSYSVGNYLTPSSYDVEDITATDIDLLYVSVEGEELIEYEQ